MYLHVVIRRCRNIDGIRGCPLSVASHVSQAGKIGVLVCQSGGLSGLQQADFVQPLVDFERVLETEIMASQRVFKFLLIYFYDGFY